MLLEVVVIGIFPSFPCGTADLFAPHGARCQIRFKMGMWDEENVGCMKKGCAGVLQAPAPEKTVTVSVAGLSGTVQAYAMWIKPKGAWVAVDRRNRCYFFSTGNRQPSEAATTGRVADETDNTKEFLLLNPMTREPSQ